MSISKSDRRTDHRLDGSDTDAGASGGTATIEVTGTQAGRDPSPPVNPMPSHAEIAHRAYDIYVSGGCTPGHCDDNWHLAEQDLKDEYLAASEWAQEGGSPKQSSRAGSSLNAGSNDGAYRSMVKDGRAGHGGSPIPPPLPRDRRL